MSANHLFSRVLVGLVCTGWLCVGTVVAGEVRIVTWNVREIFTVENVESRATEFAAMAAETRPDILCLQEVTSHSRAARVLKKMNLDAFHLACSNFTQNDNNEHASFEICIASRFPFAQVIEFDPSPDNTGDDPEELTLQPPAKLAIPAVETDRGYLWARIDQPKSLSQKRVVGR